MWAAHTHHDTGGSAARQYAHTDGPAGVPRDHPVEEGGLQLVPAGVRAVSFASCVDLCLQRWVRHGQFTIHTHHHHNGTTTHLGASGRSSLTVLTNTGGRAASGALPRPLLLLEETAALTGLSTLALLMFAVMVVVVVVVSLRDLKERATSCAVGDAARFSTKPEAGRDAGSVAGVVAGGGRGGSGMLRTRAGMSRCIGESHSYVGWCTETVLMRVRTLPDALGAMLSKVPGPLIGQPEKL